jgi:hypothetical protein
MLLLLLNPNAASGQTTATTEQLAVLKVLFNAHNLPITPLGVPQVTTAAEIDKLLTPGNHPTVFQIRPVTASDVDPAKAMFFKAEAILYAGAINFREVPAGSPAAKRLYSFASTRPIYVVVNPDKQGQDRGIVLDEGYLFSEVAKQIGAVAAESSSDWVVKQKAIEEAIAEKTGVVPTMFVPFDLTLENGKDAIFGAQPNSSAEWVTVLFYPDPSWQEEELNRLRMMLWVEAFLSGQVRALECDLSTQAAVYPTVFKTAPSGKAELWVMNPKLGLGWQYIPGERRPGPGRPDRRCLHPLAGEARHRSANSCKKYRGPHASGPCTQGSSVGGVDSGNQAVKRTLTVRVRPHRHRATGQLSSGNDGGELVLLDLKEAERPDRSLVIQPATALFAVFHRSLPPKCSAADRRLRQAGVLCVSINGRLPPRPSGGHCSPHLALALVARAIWFFPARTMPMNGTQANA